LVVNFFQHVVAALEQEAEKCSMELTEKYV